MEFFLNVFSDNSVSKYLLLNGLEPATCNLKDQGARIVPARHMWEAVSSVYVSMEFS